ncbi:DUF7662 domain-containing protein [Pontibacillus litoralis]|uniref:DUF7662 domain-containing protein n=1 Tax=Pontibacillus litoralis JSM 072002 TaxID=1385512 RepID=A0A0A5HPN8_9BACI|nr:hypothetical protein [Pontibacillus litoralis]KGX85577.1 hypothetical protein N784_08695 [Pontibacillus litoralis JSM 072002]
MGYQLERIPFELITTLEPLKNEQGRVIEYIPTITEDKKITKAVHPYRQGPYCTFTIPPNERSGVYALVINDRISYIADTMNLSRDINEGFGSIPKDAYLSDTHEINAKLLQEFYQGASVQLLFHETYHTPLLTHFLQKRFKPSWNCPHELDWYDNIHSNISFPSHTTGKYGRIFDYLNRIDTAYEWLTFTEIEAILQQPLPHSAYILSSWWGNNVQHTQAKSWIRAHYRVKKCILGRYVLFEKKSN